MVLAHARLPNLSLDPKRIAATSIAIALHVLVLMVLMLPTQTAPPKPEPELQPPLVVVPLVPIAPPPILRVPLTPAATHVVAAHQEPPADQSTSDVGVAITPPPVEIVDQVEEARPPSFAQISAVIAPAPPYPSLALSRGLSGVVTLRVRVDARGQPVEALIERSSGSKLLDEAARKFVLARWHFNPAAQDGVPIEAYALVPIEFMLAR